MQETCEVCVGTDTIDPPNGKVWADMTDTEIMESLDATGRYDVVVWWDNVNEGTRKVWLVRVSGKWLPTSNM